MPLWLLSIAVLILGSAVPARAELRGHGGPVRAIVVLGDGEQVATGSFDQSAIIWDLDGETARAVLRVHDGAVNALAALPDGRFVTGGEDGRIAIWRVDRPDPEALIEAHAGPIASLAVSSDGKRIGSASWDGTARITPLDGGAAQVLQGHAGNVNAIAFAPDGSAVTAGYDGTLRRWTPGGDARLVLTLPTALNAAAISPDGEMITAGADGILRVLNAEGAVRVALDLQSGPVTALALSPDGDRIAAATISGAVAVVSRAEGRIASRFDGLRSPVWSLAFRPNGRELLAGANDGVVRRWDLRSGEPIGSGLVARSSRVNDEHAAEPGAKVFAACAACHALTPGGDNRAGPTLYGVFGRRIATAPNYRYSEALKQLDIIWTAETIAKLFEVGPARFTPGTKMPEQRVGAADRAALVGFLEKATRRRD